MSVTILGNGYDLAALFGVNAELLDKAKAVGATIEHVGQHLIIKNGSGVTTGTVVVKGTTISLAKSKQIGPTAMEAIRYSIAQALNQALKDTPLSPITTYATVKVPAGVEAELANLAKPHKTLLDKFKPKTYPKPGMTPAEKAAWTKKQAKLEQDEPAYEPPEHESPVSHLDPGAFFSFPSNGVFKETPVALSAATKLYQPVLGTNKTYYVIALLEGLTVAACRNGNDYVAFRAAGKGLPHYMPRLGEMGFDNKGDYASVHLKVGTVGAPKTFGALIGVLGIGNVKHVGEITVLPK